MEHERVIGVDRREAYRGRILALTIDRVRLPQGQEVDMEVVRHPGSVVLLPMPDPAHIVLVRQYRYAIDRRIWELPAGSLRPAENPEAAARRECHEEVGLVPGRLECLGSFYPTPGYCDEEMIFFRLSDLSAPATRAPQDEDEQLEPRVFRLDDVRALIRRREIVDMKTALGLTLI